MPRSVPRRRLYETFDWTTLVARPWAANSCWQNDRAKKPRSSSRASRSIWWTPSSLVAVNFIACPAGASGPVGPLDRRHRHDEPTPGVPVPGLLRQDLVLEIPGEEHHRVRSRLEERGRRANVQVDARHVPPLLHRGPVRHDPCIVEEGGPLRRRAVRGEPPALRLQVPEEAAERLAPPGDARGEVLVVRAPGYAGRCLAGEQGLDARGGRPPGRRGRDREQQRSPVQRDPLDVGDRQLVTREQAGQRRQGEVAEVLVVDGVELEPGDHLAEVGHLDDRRAALLEQHGEPRDEAVQVGHVREHVVRVDHVGALALGDELAREVDPEELRDRGDAALHRYLRDVARGLDPEHRDGRSLVVLEQVPVIARHLDREAPRPEVPLPDEAPGELLGVAEHPVGERREVEVVAEQDLRRDRLGDLHEAARRAEGEVERVARLGPAEVLLAKERVRERGLPEREHGLESGSAAGAAGGDAAHFGTSRWVLYQARVRSSPCSSVKSGFQPSIRRAFSALRYWCLISRCASFRTSGTRLEPIARRMRSTSSRTVTWSSFEKLNASPRSAGFAASFSASSMYAAAPSST